MFLKYFMFLFVLLSCLPLIPDLSAQTAGTEYRWLGEEKVQTLSSRLSPPPGYSRIKGRPGSYQAWLQGLPLKPGCPPVFLHNGRKKTNQEAHAAVLNIDVGTRDLQQCADAAIRLRAEYLYQKRDWEAIVFKLTNGDPAPWSDWRRGLRPKVSGNVVKWSLGAEADGGYLNFRCYLDFVFTYAGSASLSAELTDVPDPLLVEAGDLFIQGGFPGHAVVVVDVAENPDGGRMFLLAQSFMPAQEIHVLKNPATPGCPWYPAAKKGELATPEWPFRYENLKRFP